MSTSFKVGFSLVLFSMLPVAMAHADPSVDINKDQTLKTLIARRDSIYPILQHCGYKGADALLKLARGFPILIPGSVITSLTQIDPVTPLKQIVDQGVRCERASAAYLFLEMAVVQRTALLKTTAKNNGVAPAHEVQQENLYEQFKKWFNGIPDGIRQLYGAPTSRG